MNAYQRRQHRRALPPFTGCGRQGYSGDTSYPDLMCTDGYMSDMDADGHDPSVARLPCRVCKPDEHAAWQQEEWDNEELPDGLWRDAKGTLKFECRSCGHDREWYGEPHQFDLSDRNVCGGSPRCIP